MIIGACGVCCSVCRLYTYGVCAGCAPGDECPLERVVELACPILRCASARSISFCPRDCPEYPCALYEHGVPMCQRFVAIAPQAPPDETLSAWTRVGLRVTGEDPGLRPKSRGAQLYVFCLGPFRVYRNGKKIAETEWGQGKGPAQKIKALFAYLVAKGSRGATKDQIVELLWPDQPAGDDGDARFHAALHYLRRALEPDLPSRGKSQYIIYRDGYYKLAPPDGYWVDATAFEAYYQQALRLEQQGEEDQAARHWQLAQALYQGDYMAGLAQHYTEGYEDDWCQWRRYRLRDMYLTVLLKLAHYHFRRGEDRLSRIYAQKALIEDRGCEEAHRLMMRLAHRAGQRDDLVRQYRLCQKCLEEVEDRSPAPATTRLYEELLQTMPRQGA